MSFVYDPYEFHPPLEKSPWKRAARICKINCLVMVFLTIANTLLAFSGIFASELLSTYEYVMLICEMIFVSYLLGLTFYILYAFFSWLQKREKDGETTNSLLKQLTEDKKRHAPQPGLNYRNNPQPQSGFGGFGLPASDEEPLQPLDPSEIEGFNNN